MNSRFFTSVGVLTGFIALASLTPASEAGQPPKATTKTGAVAKAWSPPRTSDGQPDLQGVWDFRTITPLERPDVFAGEFTVSDPQSYARPWTAAFPMTKTGERIFEYACHEGNYGMTNLLSGARAQEKAAEAVKTKR